VVTTPHRFSETALAFELVAKHGASFRYVVDMGQHLFWNGCVWEPDPEAHRLAQLVTPICCSAASDAPKKLVRTLESYATTRAVIRKACEDPRVVVKHAQLDTDPLLLGTPAGTWDYHSGKLRTPDPKDLITMSTTVAPLDAKQEELAEAIPLWIDFLNTIYPLVPGYQDADTEKIQFLQRWWGYCTTALVKYHHYAFFVGRGRNGKGVMFRTWRKILGDYAATIKSELLMERLVEPHRTELACLRGKRMAISSEISGGKFWNESRLNELSGGGEPIKANFMRQDEFEYYAVLKLNISSNNRPQFRTVDIHSTERLLLLEHKMHFVEDREAYVRQHPENDPATIVQQDPELEDKLTSEHPGVLQWGILGAQQMLELFEANGSKARVRGLMIPISVRDDSNTYLDAEDELGHFVGTYCKRIAPPSGEKMRNLIEVFNYMRSEERDKPITQTELRKKLETRFTVKHTAMGSTCIGIVLNDVGDTVLVRKRAEDLDDDEEESHSSSEPN
jgi:putative DNA primase/helicase